MDTRRWTVADAKAHLSEVIERAKSGEPQTITRHGKEAAVLVSAALWARKSARRSNLVDFLARSLLKGSGLKVARRRDRRRKPNL